MRELSRRSGSYCVWQAKRVSGGTRGVMERRVFPGDAGGWQIRQDLNQRPRVAFRKAMLLILLASCCVIDHDFGPIFGVLFSISSRICRLHPSDETVFDGHTCNSLSFHLVSRGSRGSGGGGDVAPFPRKFVACSRHGLKNTRVALAELVTAPGSLVCCSNSSGGR